MAKIWKQIPGYEGRYEINQFGIVRSVERYITSKRAKPYLRPGIIRKTELSGAGYLQVKLCKDGKLHTRSIHNLLAKTFIHQPAGKTQVNHKDGNKLNNDLKNLEWCTQSENMLHSRRVLKDKANKPVVCYTPEGALLKRYPSIIQASEDTGVKPHAIIDYLRGRKYSKLYHWALP